MEGMLFLMLFVIMFVLFVGVLGYIMDSNRVLFACLTLIRVLLFFSICIFIYAGAPIATLLSICSLLATYIR
jgi:hypothetical protein